MNGRIYDPTIARFISADPTIPYVFDSQSFNRYSYTRNNPLKYVDLNGYIDSYSSKNSVDKDSDSFSENNKDDDSGDSKDDDIEVSISKEDGVLSYGAYFTIEYHSDPLDSLYSGDPYESGDDDYNNYNLNFMASQDPALENGISFDILLGAAIGIPARIVRIFEVGEYRYLVGKIQGLDAHHVGQKALMKKHIKEYNINTAPSILVPKIGHTIKKNEVGVVRRSLNINITNPNTTKVVRSIIARDILELRRVYPEIPNKSLKELINLNKVKYSNYMIK